MGLVVGIKLFGEDISDLIHREMSSGLLPATLHKIAQGTRVAGSLSAGRETTTTSHAARGFVEDYEDRFVDGTVVQRGDRLVTLIGDSVADGAIPRVGDQITIEGVLHTVINVKRDPAAATYACQSRP